MMSKEFKAWLEEAKIRNKNYPDILNVLKEMEDVVGDDPIMESSLEIEVVE